MIQVPLFNYQFACTQNCDIIQLLVWLAVIVVIVCIFSILGAIFHWVAKLFRRRR